MTRISVLYTALFVWQTKYHTVVRPTLTNWRNLTSISFILKSQKFYSNPKTFTFFKVDRNCLCYRVFPSYLTLKSGTMNQGEANFASNSSLRSISPLQIHLINRLISDDVIRSQSVRDAMLSIDRADYCEHATTAYEDHPVPIGFGQTISAPHMHAWALELLKPNLKRDVGTQVLDVGCGSGILCTLFAKMIGGNNGEKVYGIDCIDAFVESARVNISKNDSKLLEDGIINLRKGNGWEGLSGGKFNVIHVGAAAESLPLSLVELLACGGIMIIPIGPTNGAQILKLITKDEKDPTKFDIKDVLGVRYVPLVKEV